MGEADDGGGFFPSLSRMAFTRAVFQSNVFLPKLNAMRIPVSFHTALKMAELSAFLNSGVTDDRNRACTHSVKAKPEGSDEVRNCCCRSREHDAETSHA